MISLKDLFLLDPDIVFLNHGSFGATPRPVFEVYQDWQRRLEHQPVQELGRELMGNLREAREALGAYLHTPATDLAFVPNATVGVNIVARSLALKPGDEVLTTDHEYGACDNIWTFVSQQTRAKFVRQPITVPAETHDEIIEQFWQGVTPRTRVIFLSHITSTTALHLPIEAVCRRAREAGILTVVDGAHGPGQIALDLPASGADFYAGNCHKWLCAPKGSGFLYTRPERQALIEPLVVSWGWGDNDSIEHESRYLAKLQWSGTRDYSAYLSVAAAIDFQREHGWDAVRARCHEMTRDAMRRVGEITGLPPLYPDDRFYHQMASLPLPPVGDLPAFKARLYDEFRIEIPTVEWNGQAFLRLSVQGYNTDADIDALIDALGIILAVVK